MSKDKLKGIFDTDSPTGTTYKVTIAPITEEEARDIDTAFALDREDFGDAVQYTVAESNGGVYKDSFHDYQRIICETTGR